MTFAGAPPWVYASPYLFIVGVMVALFVVGMIVAAVALSVSNRRWKRQQVDEP